MKLWDAAKGELVHTFEKRAGIGSVAFSPKGAPRVLSGSGGGTLKLWDAVTGQPIRTFTGHAGGVTSVAFSPDGAACSPGSWDHTVKLWDAVTGQPSAPSRSLRVGSGQWRFHPTVPACSRGWDLTFKHVKLWNAVGAAAHSRGLRLVGVTSVAFYLMAPACSRGAGISLSSCGMQRQAVCCAPSRSLRPGSSRWCFHPTARILSVMRIDGTMKLWEAATGQLLRTFLALRRGRLAGVFTRRCPRALGPLGLAQLAQEGTLKLWEAAGPAAAHLGGGFGYHLGSVFTRWRRFLQEVKTRRLKPGTLNPASRHPCS